MVPNEELVRELNQTFADQKAMVETLSEPTIRQLAWIARKGKWTTPRGYVNRTNRRIGLVHGQWIPTEAQEGVPPEGVCLTSDPKKAHCTKIWCMRVLPLATAVEDTVTVLRFLSNGVGFRVKERPNLVRTLREKGLWEEIQPVLTAMRLAR
jgi:hypothetical protein